MKRCIAAICVCCMIYCNASAKPFAIPCPFNAALTCTLFKDILNDISPEGLHYYGPTNYDHRISGEIETFDSNLVQPYVDNVNAPGQIKLIATLNNGVWKSGEIMTRSNLDQPPYNSPAKIHPFTTEDIQHGFIEAKVKLPRCDVSDDGLCQANTNPPDYTRGLWPSIWMLPTHDTDWPLNGEIDIWEAYQTSQPLNVSTSALHFNGNDPRCGGNDCKFIGFILQGGVSNNGPLYNDFHTWGFEWEPDPNSSIGGVIMTEYFDNVKIWGPITSDSLPADGPNAFSRGFHDPNGGFYLIAALAVGGGYAGNPNPHMQNATMYIQSIKAYSVGTNAEQGTVTLNFASAPNECMGITDILNIGQNDHPSFTVSTSPFIYTMNTGGPFPVSLNSTAQPIPVNGGSCQGSLDVTEISVPGQLNATYTFTATPPTAQGTIKIIPTSESDTQCSNASDNLFLDQDQTGVPFTVSQGITELVNTGAHHIKLASQSSIPADGGFCTSTLDTADITVSENETSTVNATYQFHGNSSGMACSILESTVTQQSDWGSQGIVNTFAVRVNLANFPADSTGKIELTGTLTMQNDFVQNFWGNFGMSSTVSQNVGSFTGNTWSTQLIFGGFINNKNPMHIGDNPMQSMVINGVACH